MNKKEELVSSWINYCHSKEEEHAWATEDLIDLANESPEEAWKYILDIMDQDSSDTILSNLAQGPLEDLIAEHGKLLFAEFEKTAQENSIFAKVITQVWLDGMSNDVQSSIGDLQKQYASSTK